MIILDTHVLIWAVQDNPRLGRQAAAIIEKSAAETTILIPAICAWEVAGVEKRGKVVFPGGCLSWFRRILDAPAFTLAALELEIAMASVTMEWSHKDPADRIITATALYWNMPLVTADETILAYAEEGHVRAIDARE